VSNSRIITLRRMLHGNGSGVKLFALATTLLVFGGLFLGTRPGFASQTDPTSQDLAMLEAAAQMTLGSARIVEETRYVMTGCIRLLVFWKCGDDVGGGYIRRSISAGDPAVHRIQVLFGSDPAKAPRRINNWGAGTEAISQSASAFFGFMKSTQSNSPDEAQADIGKQTAQGKFAFSAILSFVDGRNAVSRTEPLFSDLDLNLHQMDKAQQLVLNHLGESRLMRRLEPARRRCPASQGFLQAVDELIGAALEGHPTPVTSCYTYNAKNYTIALKRRTPYASKQVEVALRSGTTLRAVYRNLIDAEFSVMNDKLERSNFELWIGTSGRLRGVPMQIIYRPNWWFQVVLNRNEPSNPTEAR
jgi:hypothetical protein